MLQLIIRLKPKIKHTTIPHCRHPQIQDHYSAVRRPSRDQHTEEGHGTW